MKTVRPLGSRWFARKGLPCAALALALLTDICSCAQDVKITAPRYALVYGILNYPHTTLKYTVKDSDAMNALLTGQGWAVQESTDSVVTKDKIKNDIISLSSVAPDATILIYYSGHGTYVDSSWNSGGYPYFPTHSGAYICPYDSVNTNGLIDSTTIAYLISAPELVTWLKQAGTKNVIVILDSCFSGGFVSPGSAIDASPQDYSSMPYFSAFSTALSNFGNLLVANASASGEKTPIVLSAAGTNESSYDGDSGMQHGVFTYFLLDAAINGDADGDGFITTTEAYEYTSKRIQEWGINQVLTGYPVGNPFLPHLSGGTRDLVLFVK
jgi:Caspase domain